MVGKEVIRVTKQMKIQKNYIISVVTNLILLFTNTENIKRWWPNNDLPYMTKLHYRECGLIRKRNGMPKDY